MKDPSIRSFHDTFFLKPAEHCHKDSGLLRLVFDSSMHDSPHVGEIGESEPGYIHFRLLIMLGLFHSDPRTIVSPRPSGVSVPKLPLG